MFQCLFNSCSDKIQIPKLCATADSEFPKKKKGINFNSCEPLTLFGCCVMDVLVDTS